MLFVLCSALQHEWQWDSTSAWPERRAVRGHWLTSQACAHEGQLGINTTHSTHYCCCCCPPRQECGLQTPFLILCEKYLNYVRQYLLQNDQFSNDSSASSMTEYTHKTNLRSRSRPSNYNLGSTSDHNLMHFDFLFHSLTYLYEAFSSKTNGLQK